MANLKKNVIAALTIVGGLLAALLGTIPAVGVEPTATVTGTVFEDANGDGVQQSNEPGWPNVTIYALTADRSAFVAKATTDAQGRYELVGLPIGAHSLEFAPMSWWDVRSDWVPTTTGSVWPRQTVEAADGATANFGWRRLVRSTDLASPLSEHVGPEGLTVQSYVDAVDAREVYERLVQGMIGEEAPHVTVRLGYGSNDTTSTGVAQSQGRYTSVTAVSYVSWLSWLDSGDRILSHEYGHARSNYYAYIVQQDPTLSGYLQVRGLAGDERVGTSYAWSPHEMIAEDYRQLLGHPAARAFVQVNRDIPAAADVPGLLAYLRDEFTGTGGTDPSPEPDPTAEPDPDPTAEPDPTPEPTPDQSNDPEDTTPPTLEILSPADGESVNGSVSVVIRASDDVSHADRLVIKVRLGTGDMMPATWDPSTGRFVATVATKGMKGTQTLVVIGRDVAGNESQSLATVNVGKGDDASPTRGRGKK